MPSLVIDETEFQTFPEEVQRFLLSKLVPNIDLGAADEEQIEISSVDDEELPDLSTSQAKKVWASLSDKSKEVVRYICNQPVQGFELKDLEKRMKAGDAGLKGVWTGITKVTRRILDDREAKLIAWTENESGWWQGRLSETSYNSFRKALGL